MIGFFKFSWQIVLFSCHKFISQNAPRIIIGTLHSHYHSQITSIESGLFEVEIGGEKKILKTGDVFYIPPNVVHGVVCMEEGVLLDMFSPMREDFVKE